MELKKINFWGIGATSVLLGSGLVYMWEYKNNEWLSMLSFMFIFFGWIILVVRSGYAASINQQLVHFKDDKTAWLKQRAFNIGLFILLLAMIYTNFFYLSNLSQRRKNDILASQPTQTTVAIVDHIYARKAKSSIRYFAIFQYTANGQTATFPWEEQNEGDFKAGDKYMIKYSVEHPDMIVLVRKVE